jgi:phosphoribosylformylglycinamidine cyclo-ligase
VHIEEADRIKKTIARQSQATRKSRAIGFGSFGSAYRLEGYSEPVLVSSCDGVGTKLRVAALLNRNEVPGIDIVNHCVNDILCLGATPLFFLDYIAMGRLVPEQVEQIVGGMTQACQAVGCALIGGETAEMPGVYTEASYDVVGFVVGAVERHNLIDGQRIAQGDIVLGLPSSGLHTNGYSLVRRVFDIDNDPQPLRSYYPELGRTLGEELLQAHRCYFEDLKDILHLIKGLAHITGGSFAGNIPRSLPETVAARICADRWAPPAIFRLIQEKGNIAQEEMYRVFNMGIGMVVVCGTEEAEDVVRRLPEARTIGEIITAGRERVILE